MTSTTVYNTSSPMKMSPPKVKAEIRMEEDDEDDMPLVRESS